MSTDPALLAGEGLLVASLVSRYFAGIALTLSAYDWLILIERESQTAWKARWTRTKTIYYINRVITLVGLVLTVISEGALHTSDGSLTTYLPVRDYGSVERSTITGSFYQDCKFYMWSTALLQLLSIYIGNVILTLRVVALYNRHLMITRILYVCLVLNCLLTFIPAVVSLNLWTLSMDYSPLLHECITFIYSPSGPIIFIAPAVFEVTLFAFTLYRAILDYRNGTIDGYPNARFLAVLYRDGFYYFAAVGAVHTCNALESLIAPESAMEMGIYLTWAVMTVMSSRVYLNLVLVAHGGGTDELTTGSLFSFRSRRADHSDGTEREVGHIVTFGGKRIQRRVPLTTFTMHPVQTTISTECNTQPDAEPDSSEYRN